MPALIKNGRAEPIRLIIQGQYFTWSVASILTQTALRDGKQLFRFAVSRGTRTSFQCTVVNVTTLLATLLFLNVVFMFLFLFLCLFSFLCICAFYSLV